MYEMNFWGASENEFWAVAHQSYSLPSSKFVNAFSLHPDFLTVFDKMTQEQDKLKCCNRILTCRVLVLLYEHEHKIISFEILIICYVYMFMFFRVLYFKVRYGGPLFS